MARSWRSLAGVLLLATVGVVLIEDVATLKTHAKKPHPKSGARRRFSLLRSKWQWATFESLGSTATHHHPTTDVSPPTSTYQRGDQPPPTFGDYDEDQEDLVFFPLSSWKPQHSTNSPSFQTEYRGYYPPEKEHACHKSSCYPATGNLLIGRENRLHATSTCGLRRPERFCIVSHLEEKKCFLCDTRPETRDDPHKNHRIGQITYKAQPGTREHSWWQSENGRENVAVQLDLEAEFHFTHLIITFATFRPAAMLIERSYDFGKSWHVYKYFAHSCAQSFPGIPLTSTNITDVVCDHRYSGVEPSKNGEVIFRVLPPSLKIENPYATHVQNMLKMTNLRINFTRLHNLGDTLLDDRLEIKEKYYYAISNMVVRGSCSCNGHASKCLPLEGVRNQIDMVHGRCECTHNTKGLNCEECEDFYNDLPWQPALGKQSNACKQCSCNSHANSCHFDPEAFKRSGKVSGGTCDNCQHNTQGQHCEECIPFFYRDPEEDIQSPYVCKACDCNDVGSLDDGICDSNVDKDNGVEAGACHCKANVKGRKCDSCKDGFWNMDEHNPEGCEACTCNILGTHNNSGCNTYTGECTCKLLVTGKDCNQCFPETYGLSESEEGCALCDCYPGGSLDNYCDVLTGQCKCRNYMTGRRCDTPTQNYFIPSLQKVYEAESATGCNDQGHGPKCTIVAGEWPIDRRPTTGPGYIRATEGTEINIRVDDVPRTMEYDVIVRYWIPRDDIWEDARITVIRPEEYDPEGPCANSHPYLEQNIEFRLPARVITATALPEVCLEQDKVYHFKIYLYQHRKNEANPSAQIYIDSLSLIPRIEATTILSGSPPAEIRSKEFERLGCNQSYYRVNDDPESDDPCEDILKQTSIEIYNGPMPCNCNPTGSLTKKCKEFGGICQCKPNIVGRQCDRCAPGTYGFGPEGCKSCDCNQIGALDNECDLITGQCKCQPNTYGRECDQCQPGFWNFTMCEQCNCNGHSQTCNAKTGECIECSDFTTGFNCHRCIEGFYGDPLLGSEVGCRACHCPNTIASGHSHATQCDFDSRNQDMVCYCQEGYAGARCDVCADNYFGHPELPGGTCEKCECNNNVDLNDIGNCDSHTGECLKCLMDTAGSNCEICKDNFYGNALTQTCTECDCHYLGTNQTIKYCDRYTGQCPCLANVLGTNCDTCTENHWKIASGEGCEHCECDPIGSETEQCHPYEGQCTCKDGFGGRQCNQCREHYWGDPNKQCQPCECDYYGTANQQCNRETGQCQCITGISGYKCDQCDRGYEGQAPHCSACGECFDNWDLILNGLQAQTSRVISQAKEIKTLGATGAYTKEFDAMEQKLATIRSLLDNTTVTAQDISDLDDVVQKLREHLNQSLDTLVVSEATLDSVYSGITLANAALDELRNRSEQIKSFAKDLKGNATQLQEANIEGALNLTREAYNRARLLQDLDAETDRVFANAEKQCNRTKALVIQKESEFELLQKKNEEDLDAYHSELQSLISKIPDLNEQMCDKRGDPCDSLCGGAGCDHCGGLSCEKGAITMADKALSYVKDVEKSIKSKDGVAEDLIRSLNQAKQNASDALEKSERAYLEAVSFLNETERLGYVGDSLFTNLTNAYENDEASPEEISRVAQKTLDLELELDPEQITTLASKIDETVSQLEDVEAIIDNTRQDIESVNDLKEQANDAKTRAENVLLKAKQVKQALDDAETAQTKASDAIEVAKNNIALAVSDLEKIDSQTGEAKAKATETADKVNQMNAKVNEIQKTFQRNDVDAAEIKVQAETVRDLANNAHDEATKLRDSYKKANDSLTEKAVSSENARNRAQQLLQRASKITSDTSTKLRDLESLTGVHKTNTRELDTLRTQLDGLNSQMDGYLEKIRTSADNYRYCT